MNLKKHIKKALVCAIALTLFTGLQAQSFYVLNKDKQASDFSVSNIKSISFNNGNIVINKTDASISEVLLSNVRHLSFTNYQSTTSVEEVSKSTQTNNLNCYPNPVSSQLNIEMADYEGYANIEILSASGQSVYNKNNNYTNNTLVINTSNLNEGIYILRATMEDNTKTASFIKK